MSTAAPGAEVVTEGRSAAELDVRSDALSALTGAGVPFLVAGAYAFFEYTGAYRDTKSPRPRRGSGRRPSCASASGTTATTSHTW